MELYENCPCNEVEELSLREDEVIREIWTLNKRIEVRTKKEYRIENADKIKEKDKQYYIENIDKIQEKDKQYHIENMDEIQEKDKEYHIENGDKLEKYQKEYRIEIADPVGSPRLVSRPLCTTGSVAESLVVALVSKIFCIWNAQRICCTRALQPVHVCPEVLTSCCIWAGGERFVRELMALLGATAQEIVNMARLAFGGTRAQIPNAERAANMGVFCKDGITGDGRGLNMAGVYSTRPSTHAVGRDV